MKTLTLVSFLLAIATRFGALGQVISEPDDVTVCEGKSTTFTCVLDSSISSDDVQWYRLIEDTSTAEMVDLQGNNFDLTTSTINNTINSSLNITNAIKSYTGYYWVRLPSDDVCNASLTVKPRPPALTVNITKNTESSSVVVQWDEVDDSLPTTYIVIWTSENDLNNVQVKSLEEQSSYTITELTLDTVYTITVTAHNGCGTGPEYITSVSLTSDTTSTTSSIIIPTSSISTNSMITSSTEDPTTTSAVVISTTSTTTTTTAAATTAAATTATTTTTTAATTTATTTVTTTAATTTAATTATTTATVTTIATTTHVTTTPIKMPSTTAPAIIVTTTSTTAVAVVSSSSIAGITNINNPITATTTITTTATAKSSSTTITNPGTTATTISTVVAPTGTAGPRNPAGTTSQSSDDNATGYIAGTVIVVFVILLVIFIIMVCYFAVHKRDRGSYKCKSDVELSGHNNLSSDNGKVPSVANVLAIHDEEDGEPYKLRADTSHQMSHTVEPYMMTNVGNSEDFDLNSHPLDLPNSYGQLEPKQMSNADDRSISQEPLDPPDPYDKLGPEETPSADDSSVSQNADDFDPHKDTDDVVHHSDAPAVRIASNDSHSTTDDAIKRNNDPSLHYAELQLLPPPTGRHIVKDDPPIIYAQVA